MKYIIDKEDETYTKNILNNVYNVSRETMQTLDEYIFLLLKWNNTINLVSKTTISKIWSRHILDCAQIIKFIPDKSIKLVDLGSGAGLPGIILAILGVEDSILVEADARKCAFLQEASKLVSQKIKICCERIEKIAQLECDIVVSRSLINLTGLFNYIEDFKISDKMLFSKGENVDIEIEAAQKLYNFLYKQHISITNINSSIIEVNEFKKIIKSS